MITVRFMVFALLATFLTNRLISILKTEQSKRVYKKEMRYYFLLGLGCINIILATIFIADPSLLGITQFQTPEPLYWIGNAMIFSGILLWLWSKHSLGDNWSPRIAIRQDHTLTTNGPYRYVRHPIYTAYIIDVIGITLASANLALIIPGVIIASLTWWRSSDEEVMLKQQFGLEYQKYSENTGKFFPKVF